MSVCITMQVGPVQPETFQNAVDWLNRQPAAGFISRTTYHAEDEPSTVLMVELWESHEAFHHMADALGDEFNRRAGTAALSWADRVWVASGEASDASAEIGASAPHITTVRFQALPGRRDAVIERFQQWQREERPLATGFSSSTLAAGNTDPNAFASVVRWDSLENYNRNSNRPGQDAWYQRLRADLAADPAWFDGTVIAEFRS